MTYTFKLSRRLAISRYAAFATFAMLFGCDGETTGPQTDLNTPTGAAPWIRVVPSTVTIETNQTIGFRGERRTARGDVRPISLWWQASGGTIDRNGAFVASAPGVYKVIGRGRSRQKPDTSTVVVVPKQRDLAGVSVSPDTVTLNAGASQTFTATGVRSDGSTVAIGVTWQAGGGTIDAGGVYTAGTTAGSYRVIAASTDGTLADTALVGIPQPSPAPSTPTLARVVLKPASVSITTGGTKQFVVYGWDSGGDSVAVDASFSASGGTITSTGLYTAGSTTGAYRVIAVASGLADTTAVTVSAPPTTGGKGVPFGPFALPSSSQRPFSMATQGTTASAILQLISAARSSSTKLVLLMAGGSHDNYMSTIDGVYQFDMAKWKARMDTYDTPTIRDAVAKAVSDGILVGNSVMDEPHVCGKGDGSGGGDGNTWGPCGTMTKARVDTLCAYVKGIFPTLPVGVGHRHDLFEPDKDYQKCEFVMSQYSTRVGPVADFRDSGLKFGARSHVSILFSMNILNGGTQDKDGTWDCKDQGGYKGQNSPNCQMTPDQVRNYGLTLGPAGCALTLWKYNDAFMSRATNQTAFQAVADGLASATRKPCLRT